MFTGNQKMFKRQQLGLAQSWVETIRKLIKLKMPGEWPLKTDGPGSAMQPGEYNAFRQHSKVTVLYHTQK